jgi:ribosomal protein L9
MKRTFAFILAIVFAVLPLASCGGGDKSGGQLLSFSQAQSIEEMEKLDGKTVTIIGYMSTLSPISGEFMYLMNLPYQSCPFCVPNTTQLANTMAVYAKSAEGFEFTDRAIQVTGTLEFGDYTDEFGYEYNYRIKDATYTVLNTDDMDPKIKLWQQLASTDVIAEIYQMYEYVNFLCFWPTYTAQFEGGSDYLYPSDIDLFCKNDGAQFNYGYKEGYFDDLVAKVESVSKTDFAPLVENIRKAEALDKASKLKGQTLTIAVKAIEGDEEGKLYGSVTAADVAKALTEAGVAVDAAMVKLEEPIKNLGTTDITIALMADVSVVLKLAVIAE